MNETALVKQILQYLGWRKGVFAYRQNTGAVKIDNKRFVSFGFPGLADIIGIYRGRYLAIEAKIRPNKQTAQQKAFEETVGRYGGLYILAYDLKNVTDVLDEEDKKYDQ